MAEPAIKTEESVTRTQTTLDRSWNEICELGLQKNVAELDAYGYTIVPPEIANPNGLAQRLLEACLDIAERRNGERPDLETGSTHINLEGTSLGGRYTGHGYHPHGPLGDVFHSLLLEDEVFEEVLMNPVRLALVTHLIGYNAVMSSMGCWMKGPNSTALALHADNSLPSPLPPHAIGCQTTYWLTDYTRENGSTAVVPGSHKWCRQPLGEEKIVPEKEGDRGNQQAIPLEGKAGSLLVHHSNLWHGAYNRAAPGVRVSLTNYMLRHFMRTTENYIDKIPQDALDRHPPRFAILTQQGVKVGGSNPAETSHRVETAEKYLAAYAKEIGEGYLPVEQ